MIGDMMIVFDHGERRHVRLLIHSCKNEAFEILDAAYELTALGDEEPEDSGACVISEHIIDMAICPQNKGMYRLEVTYHIADETLIEVVKVRVI